MSSTSYPVASIQCTCSFVEYHKEKQALWNTACARVPDRDLEIPSIERHRTPNDWRRRPVMDLALSLVRLQNLSECQLYRYVQCDVHRIEVWLHPGTSTRIFAGLNKPVALNLNRPKSHFNNHAENKNGDDLKQDMKVDGQYLMLVILAKMSDHCYSKTP